MTKEDKIVMDKYAIGEIKAVEPSINTWPTPDPNYVFVYGSLKRGFGNHRLVEDSTFVGSAMTLDKSYEMVSMGGFPGVIDGKSNRIQGELYEIDDKVFKLLDRLESNGSFYERHLTNVILLDNPNGGKKYKAWIYIIKDSEFYRRPLLKNRIAFDAKYNAESWEISGSMI